MGKWKRLFYNAVEQCVRWKQSIVEIEEISQTTADKYRVLADAHIIPYFKGKQIRLRDITSEDIKDYYTYLMRKRPNGKQAKQPQQMNIRCI